jgi:hypothetical protein
MNMQTIQILFLLLDGVIKLAPWRIVTETMERIGYGASESLARSLGVFAVSCAGLCAFPPIPVIGPLMQICHSCGAIASFVHIGSSSLGLILFVLGLGAMLLGGFWLRDNDCARKCGTQPIGFVDSQGEGTFHV